MEDFIDADGKRITRWSNRSDRTTIKILRAYFGLPEVVEKLTKCKKCSFEFETTFKFGRAQQFYCSKCRHSMADDDCPVYGIPK